MNQKTFKKMITEDLCQEQSDQIKTICKTLRGSGYKFNEIQTFFKKTLKDQAVKEVHALCDQGFSDSKISSQIGYSFSITSEVTTEYWAEKMKHPKKT